MTDIVVQTSEELLQCIQAAIAQYPQVVSDAVWAEMQTILQDAQAITPVDTGLLRASGHVSDPIVTDGEIDVEIGFYTNYAIYVHEDLSAKHPTGQAKFLETAIDDHLDDLAENILKRVDQTFAEGA